MHRLARAGLAATFGWLAASCAVPAAAWELQCPNCAGVEEGDIPFQWDDGAAAPPVFAPYAQGFTLTVPVVPGRDGGPVPARLDRYVEVAAALGRCWSPLLRSDDARWRDLTLRISFRRDGAVNGLPRVVHVTDPVDAAAGEAGRRSLFGALDRCTPLAFSPSLGRAIAGQIFAIRFVQQRNS